jgi:protein-disulfide isomerase
VLAALAGILPAGGARAARDLEWGEGRDLPLQAEPLDVAGTDDGKWLFVLTRGAVLAWSVSDGKVIREIPVGQEFDRVAYSSASETLVVTSRSGKTARMVRLEFVHLFPVEGLPFKGAQDAAVTVAVFDDYQCPYCARLEPLLQQVLERYPKDVKIVHKNFPLQSHAHARTAAAAALAAHAQGKFWEFHRKLFENQKSMGPDKIQEIARELGLDMERFNADSKSPAVENLIRRDVRDGQEAGVEGTPTIFINGKLLKRYDLQGFAERVEAELRKRGGGRRP